MSYGRYFEELEAGQHYEHWPGRTIEAYDDTLFSLLSMNQHPLHIDDHYAKGTQHGRRLVEGPIVIGLVIGLTQADIAGRSLRLLEMRNVRHTGPVFHGDTIRAESTIVSTEDRGDGTGVVVIESAARNQKLDVILTMQHSILVPKQPR